MKALRWLCWFTLLLTAIILSSLSFLVFSEAGLQQSVVLAQKILPGKLRISAIQGRLWDRWKIDELTYDDAKLSIHIGHIEMDWRPSQRLFNRWQINNLIANDVKIRDVSPAATNQSNTALLQQVARIDLRRAQLHNIDIITTAIAHPILITDATLDAERQERHMQINNLHIVTSLYDIALRGQISPQAPYPFDIKIQGSNSAETTQKLALWLHLTGTLDQFQFQGEINEPFKTHMQGQIDFTKSSPTIAVDAKWQQLQWPLLGKPEWQSDTGELHVTGPRENLAITLAAGLQHQNFPRTQIRLASLLHDKQLIMNDIDVTTSDGRIFGTAKLGLDAQHNWAAQLTAQRINPHRFAAAIAGDINANINAQGHYANANIHINAATVSELHGQLHGMPLTGQLNYQQLPQGFKFDNSELHVGNNHLVINGGFDKTWQLKWTADLQNLTQLLHGSIGSVHSTGQVAGPRDNANVRVIANANKLRYRQRQVDNIKLDLSGTLAQHTLTISANHPLAQLATTVHGGYRNDAWTGQFDKFTLSQPGLDNWNLTGSEPIHITSQKITLPKLCLHSQKQQFCIQQATQSGSDWQLAINAQHIALQQLQSLLPNTITINSTIDAELQLQSHDNNITGKSQITLAPGILGIHLSNREQQLAFKRGTAIANIDQSGLHATLNIDSDVTKAIHAAIALPQFRGDHAFSPQQPIQADIAVTTHELSWLSLIYSRIDKPQGELTLKLTVAGTLAKPNVHGTVDLHDTSLKLLHYGTDLSHIHINASAISPDTMAITGTAQAGDGNLRVDGTSKFYNGDLHTDVRVQGRNVQFLKTHEYDIIIDPDLTLHTTTSGLNVSGSITVPKARISPEDFSDTIELPDEVSYVEKQKKIASTPFRIATKITITAGSDVQLTYKGLQGQIQGAVTLQDDNTQSSTATGQLHITNGKYRAYGQNLTIHNGSLFYTGNRLDNPGINVNASREIDTLPGNTPTIGGSMIPNRLGGGPLTQQKILVGINITGTVNDPRINLYSRPALPQSDILSYLVLGKPISLVNTGGGASVQDSDILVSALSALNVGSHSSEQITKQLQHRLGIDKFEIATRPQLDPTTGTPVNNTALTVGKAITSKLYIDYTHGLLQSLNIVRITYRLTNHIMLQSENSATANSGDILYSIERN